MLNIKTKLRSTPINSIQEVSSELTQVIICEGKDPCGSLYIKDPTKLSSLSYWGRNGQPIRETSFMVVASLANFRPNYN